MEVDIFLLYFLRQSLSGPEAYHSAHTGCPVSPKDPLVTASPTLENRGTALCPTFYRSAHNRSQFLMLVQAALHPLSIFPDPARYFAHIFSETATRAYNMDFCDVVEVS